MSLSPTQNPRKSLKTGSEERRMHVDRISDLPDNVTDQILSCLSIKVAARTSVLSSKWRCKWETVPCLVLDDQSFRPPTNDEGVSVADKLIKNIDRLLFLHSGPLSKFELSYPTLSIPADDIDKWIRHVLRHSLRGFSLKISNLEHYKIPSFVFSCQNVTQLHLTKCSLRPPSAFKGFKNLSRLVLYSAAVSQDALEFLISSSPMLKKLFLKEINGLRDLNVNAPNLQYFAFAGDFIEIKLKNSFRVDIVSIDAFNRASGIQNDYRSNLVKLLTDIPQVRQLHIIRWSLEHLARGYIPRDLPVHCVRLDHLLITVNLSSFNEMSALLCLLRSVPNLQKLKLNMRERGAQETSSEVWKAEQWNCPFTRLRHIRVFNTGEPKIGLDFVKFMLSTTPVLESMDFTLKKVSDDQMKYKIVKQLCSFKRASPLAEVICN